MGIVTQGFNVISTDDGKLVLEWNTVDPINRAAVKHFTVHNDVRELLLKVQQILNVSGVVKL